MRRRARVPRTAVGRRRLNIRLSSKDLEAIQKRRSPTVAVSDVDREPVA
jgi:hypothetical protein